MANVEKITIALTSDMAAMIKTAVQGGEYATASEVIREALRDWKYKQEFREQKVEEIRKLWQEGIDSGSSKLSDFDAIKSEARKRLKKK
jgi:antitoxin ParD1/3/4